MPSSAELSCVCCFRPVLPHISVGLLRNGRSHTYQIRPLGCVLWLQVDVSSLPTLREGEEFTDANGQPPEATANTRPQVCCGGIQCRSNQLVGRGPGRSNGHTSMSFCTVFLGVDCSVRLHGEAGDQLLCRLIVSVCLLWCCVLQAEQLEHWQHNRRQLAFSTVGTPDYIAPEVWAPQAALLTLLIRGAALCLVVSDDAAWPASDRVPDSGV